MKARLESSLRKLGPAGVLGVGVLLACAGFWMSALGPLEDELAARRSDAARAAAPSPYRPVSAAAPAADLERFHALFPPASALTDELERLHGLARRAGLELAQGEYRLERQPAGLWSYRVLLPVAGRYSELRRFVDAVLREMPAASLDALRFGRERAGEAQLQAELRLTIHVRPDGETR